MAMDNFKLTITHRDATSKARTGTLLTPHGEVALPMFMPVGTLATVKTLSSQDLRDAGAGMFCQYLPFVDPPRDDVVAAAGGLHHL
jgi:queuine tRNA-ribosyltransferase